MLPPLTTATDGPFAWGYDRTLPLPTRDDAVATYYPQTDLFYLKAPNADVDEWAFAEPNEWSLDAIADATDSAETTPEDLTLADVFAALDHEVDTTVAHEIGHTTLSKRTPQQNPSLILTLAQNGMFGRAVSKAHYERDELRRLGLTFAAGEAGIAHTQNVAAPIHEAMASITQACLAEGPTAENLRSRLDRLATELGGPAGWTLAHPGYDPFAREADADESWSQYLRSYELSVLAAVQPLFTAFTDEVVYALLTTAATASIRAPMGESDRLVDDQQFTVPTVVFVDAIAQLTTGTRLYQDLFDAGLSLPHLASVFEESVGTGGAGVDQAGETLADAYSATMATTDVSHADEILTHTTATYRRSSVPSFILVEEPATETVRLHALTEGLPLSHLAMTLLRVTYLQSLYVGRPRFQDETYSSLLRALIANAPGLPDEPVAYLRRLTYLTTRTADQLSRETFPQNVRAQYATRNSSATSWLRLRSELKTDRSVDTDATTFTYESGMPLTYFLPAAAATYFEDRLLAEAIETYTAYASYALTHETSETFGALIHIFSQFEATTPATPRLGPLYRAMAAWASDQADPDGATARVFGTALARLFVYPSTESTAWSRRLYAEYRERATNADDGSPLRPLITTGLARIVRADTQTSEASIDDAIGSFLRLIVAAETDLSQSVASIGLGVADAIEFVCDRNPEAPNTRRKQLRALRDGLLETAKQSELGLPASVWVNVAAVSAASVAQRGMPPAFADEYTTFRRLAVAIIENTSTEWGAFYEQFTSTLVRDCAPSTVTAWAEVELSILTTSQTDVGTPSAVTQPSRLARFVSHLLQSLATAHAYETAASVADQLRDRAISHLSWGELTPILQRPLKTRVSQETLADDPDGWRQFTREAFTGDASLTQSRRVFISVYGGLLAWLIETGDTGPNGGTLAAIVDDMRAVVNTTTLPAEALMGGFGFATAVVARDGDRADSATVTWVSWLQQTVGDIAATRANTAALIHEYGLQLITHHALFDEPSAATASLTDLLAVFSTEYGTATTTRLPALLGAGMVDIGRYAVQFDEGDLSEWMDCVYDTAEQHARAAPDQGPFLASTLTAFVQQMLQRRRQTSGALVDALTLATAYANQTASQSQLDDLPAALWVYTTAQVDRDYDGIERTRLLRTLRHTAPAHVDSHSWNAFAAKIERYESRAVGDTTGAIEMLGPVIDETETTRLPTS